MVEPSYPADAHDFASDAEELERIDSAATEAPKGAVVVSAIAVAALLVGWLLLYFWIFIPRGTVG
ncbi:MAG TPA: hypothetical protein VHN55_05465 [Sphingomicrobium sp.]|nr:hypothetical protein [Sphingomicrobium sp.]